MRSDLIVDMVKASMAGNAAHVKRVVEALAADERAKQHHGLADRLLEQLKTPEARPSTALTTTSSEAGYLDLAPRRRLDDVVLMPSVERQCRELLEEHHRIDLLRANGLEPRHRVLLIGPPGNGKTSLAEAIAHELMVPLITVHYEALITSFLGETAARLQKLFAQARQQRCVLFFDEFDAIGKERGDAQETGEIKRVVSSLLLQIDQLPPHVVVIAATNHSDLLDKAIWRRFQVRLNMPAPSKPQRISWLERFASRSNVNLGYSPTQLAQKLGELSYAELEEFGLDVLRRFVLGAPNVTAKQVVASRLKDFSERAKPTRKR